MSVKLGYACISQTLRKQKIYTGRTITIKKIHSEGIDAAKELALLNIDDLYEIIEYNETLGIRFFRITSNLFPHIGDPQVPTYNIDFARNKLSSVGKLIRELGHRVTMHPGQYVQLGTPFPNVLKNSIYDLTHHADILIQMGLTPALGSVLIVHGGGAYGDKHTTLSRWEHNFKALPKSVRDFIVLENDDHIYTILDLLPICEQNSIPLCIDFFHHMCNGAAAFDVYDPNLLARVIKTWKYRGIKPKCHWSNQAANARKGSHSDFIEDIPPELINVAKLYDMDIMCECKQKDLCVLRLLNKYFTKNICNNSVYWTIN